MVNWIDREQKIIIKKVDVIWQNEKSLVKTKTKDEGKINKNDSFLCPKK